MIAPRRRPALLGPAVAALAACGLGLGAAPAEAQSPPVATIFFAQDAGLPATKVGLVFTLANVDATPLTGVGVGVSLPAGLVVATPNALTTTCTTAPTAPAGGSAISISGATLAAAGDDGDSCVVTLDVVPAAPGVVSVSTGAPTSIEGGTGSPSGPASLNVLSPPTIGEAFAAPEIAVGATTTVTYTLANPNAATAFYNIAFLDTLPAGLRVASPAGVAGTCLPDGTVVAQPGGATIELLGQQVNAASSCSFSVDVTATAPTTSPNPTGPVTFDFDSGGGSFTGGSIAGATATLVGVGPPTLTASFGAPAIATGATAPLAFRITNPNATKALSSVGFSAALPAGLVVATPTAIAGSCGGGTITALAGSGSIALAGATVAAAGSCTFSVAVTGTSEGQKTIATSKVSSAEGGVGAEAGASLNVAVAPAIQASFGAPTVELGGSATLTLTIANANQSTALTGLAFGDVLPAGLVVQSTSGTCGGAVAAASGGGTVALSAGTLAPRASCAIDVVMTATSLGEKTNSTGPVSSAEAGSGAAATAAITVVAPADAGRQPAPPSNAFTVARLKIAGNGTATFDVRLPGAGRLAAVESIARKRRRVTLARKVVKATKAGTLHVRLTPSRRARRTLRRAGRRVRVRLAVTFTPDGGSARTIARTVVVRPR